MSLNDHFHFIGIGGIGMSGLAKILLEQKKNVSGSDITLNTYAQKLAALGAEIYLGHDRKNLKEGATVVITSDLKDNNPEVEAAKEFQNQIIHRSDMLAAILQEKNALLVAGTHGKTTTSSLLAHVLCAFDANTGFCIGGILKNFETNAQFGQSIYFVAEADESDGSFLKYLPHALILTNINTDHIAHYKTFAHVKQAFLEFINKVPSHLRVLCIDDRHIQTLGVDGITYGMSCDARFHIQNIRHKNWSTYFDIVDQANQRIITDIELAMIGEHNVLNATAVFILCQIIGIPEEAIRSAFKTFLGVARRLEKKGEERSILVFDDYAHHPTEISCTLQALRKQVQERRVIAVFQPHRYSRMKDVMYECTTCFDTADIIIVTDIHTANEMPIPGVTVEAIIDIIKSHTKAEIIYIPRKNIIERIVGILRPFDVVITLGAGDITHVSSEIVKELSNHNLPKFKLGIVYGGESSEFTISTRSAQTVYRSIDKEYFDIQLFQISQEGTWSLVDDVCEKQEHVQQNIPISAEVLQALTKCDCIFPVFHGPMGEDGTVQGLFEMLHKPYVGCDVTSSSLAMNKVLTKRIALSIGIKTAPYRTFSQSDWIFEKKKILQECSAFNLPIFVKPVHLGSAIGVKRISAIENLEEAIEYALLFDTDVLVEEGICNIRELEFAVMGNSFITSSNPGEILAGSEMYDFDKKYGDKCFSSEPKAILSEEKILEGQQLALKIYKETTCKGLARVDFFLDQTGSYWLNEINPIPGLTKNSLYHRMWESNGLSNKDLFCKLILMALSRFYEQKRTHRRAVRMHKMNEQNKNA